MLGRAKVHLSSELRAGAELAGCCSGSPLPSACDAGAGSYAEGKACVSLPGLSWVGSLGASGGQANCPCTQGPKPPHLCSTYQDIADILIFFQVAPAAIYQFVLN